jgi:hypothetical protein
MHPLYETYNFGSIRIVQLLRPLLKFPLDRYYCKEGLTSMKRYQLVRLEVFVNGVVSIQIAKVIFCEGVYCERRTWGSSS